MQRRTLLSASLGLGSLGSLALTSDVLRAKTPPRLAQPLPTPLSAPSALTPYSGSALAFGTSVTIKVLHDDPQDAKSAIHHALAQVQTIDALMSLHQERSQVFQLNQRGSLDDPDPQLLNVLSIAQQLSLLTAGAFDITVQPLWQAFSVASARGELPSANQIAAVRPLVNWQSLMVSPKRVQLQNSGMAITLNGLAQGYAVDQALVALRSYGIQHALLDTGEFGTIGNKAPNQPWKLGIGHPRQHDALSARLAMDGRKVATSGDYETFFSADFVHHHIFNPATGDSPLELASVTVVAPTGILADGLSTAFMVMGSDKALALTAKLHDVDTLLIHKNGVIRKSPNFPEWPT
jgi:thiamine biosynthesis lipoprotein